MKTRETTFVSLATAVATMCPGVSGGNFQQLVLHVDDDAPPGGDGSSWATAFRSLQDALDRPATSPSGPVYLVDIRIAGGRFVTPTDGGPRPFTIDQEAPQGGVGLGFGLHYRLRGGFNGLAPGPDDDRDPEAYPTVLDGDVNGDDGPAFENYGDNAPGILRVNDGATVLELDGLTLRGATGDGFTSTVEYDLGLTTSGLTMSFIATGCVFRENRAIASLFLGPWRSKPDFVSVELSGSTISDNEVTSPSGTLLDSVPFRDNFRSVSRCVFERNTSGRGVYEGEQMVMSSTVIANNHATADGAGTLSLTETGSVFGCLFVGNTASRGGAIRVFRRTDGISLGSNTFADNTAETGGAVCFEDVLSLTSPVPIWNSVFSRNNATVGGENIALQDGGPYVVLSNSVLDGGAASIEQPPSGGTAVLFGSLVLDADPRFELPIGPGMGWRDADYRLGPGSPAIDAGNTAAYPPGNTDLNGDPRVVDALDYADIGIGGDFGLAVVDMGCYEAPADLPAGCPADLARPWGVLDLADIVAFVNAFGTGDPIADLAPPAGVFDLADIVAFVGAFDGPCPP